MAQAVENLLESLEELLEEGMGVPLSGGKRMVDVDEARDIIDEIRENMPAEIENARGIVAQKQRILAKAKKEAEEIVKSAEENARKLISKEEVLRQAQAQAKEIREEANTFAVQIRGTVTKYCENMLVSTQSRLEKSMTEVQTIIDSIQKK